MKHYCVISHTHWDREWYFTQEQFRVRLADLMDHLLDLLQKQPNYVFHLDAQTVILEDYWEIRPENRELYCRFIREGRLLVGPWYVQNDFYLVSGEATIRNLLLGIDQANSYGKCMMVGYAADQFGLISQLPQLLKGFDIESCLFGRGYNQYYLDENNTLKADFPPAEFLWKSPDGSSIFSVCMSFWYNNAQRFSADIQKALELVRWQDAHFQGIAQTPYLLCMNGCDHLEAQEDLLTILEQVQARLAPGEKIHQTTMEDYFQKVKAYLAGKQLPVHTGELLRGLNEDTLKDTSSSRIYLKTQNAYLQNLLEKQLEPLFSILELSGMDGIYQNSHFKYLWRMLIRNHAHDSICGCSKDAVHRHMEERFAAIAESAEALLDKGLQQLSTHWNCSEMDLQDYMITVVNPLSETRTETVDVVVDVLRSEKPKGLRITTPEGTEIAYTLLQQNRINRRITSPINLPSFLEVERYHIRMLAENIPGFGAVCYRIQTNAPVIPKNRPPKCNDYSLENQYLRVDIQDDGSVDLLDKMTCKKYQNILVLEDCADLGSSYISLPLPGDIPIRSTQFRPEITVEAWDDLLQAMTLHIPMLLPECLCADQKARSSHLVSCPVAMTLSLGKEDKLLRVHLEIENHAKDHRVKALIQTGIVNNLTFAASPFDVVCHNKTDVDTRICSETLHNSGFVTIHDGAYAVSVFNRGIYGYENLQREDGTIALTVLRSTGRIWRQDTLGAPEDDAWHAPENQCIRTVCADFGIASHPVCADMEQMLLSQTDAFQVPLIAKSYAVDSKKFLGGRPALQDSNIAELFYQEDSYPNVRLPRQFSPIQIEGNIQISAFKKAYNGNGYVLRFWNPTSELQTATFNFKKLPIQEVCHCNLREIPGEAIELVDHCFTMQIKSKQIVSVLLR